MKNKNFLIVALLLIISLLLPSCQGILDVHECNFSSGWENDDAKHWHECECGLKSDVGDHEYVIKTSDNAVHNLAATVNTAPTATFTANAIDEVMYGDADGDKQIDMNDVISTRKYVTSFDYDLGTSNVNVEAGADANGDGKINMKDIVLLRKYIVNYDYETGSSTVTLGPSHIPVDIPAVEPTCTTTGLTKGSKCSICGKILTAQQIVPVKDHSFGSGVLNGDKLMYTCSVCNYTKSENAFVVTVKHLKIDGSEAHAQTVVGFPLNADPYKVEALNISGLVPSHDYVMLDYTSSAATVTIYYSQIDVWDGSSVSSSLKGSGTASDPYLIQSGADLAYIDKNMTAAENFKGVYFKMTKSIDLNGKSVKIGYYPGWSGRIIFNGIFDGNNCSIRNLNMTDSGMGGGLFSVVSGTVKNLTVYGTVKGNDKMVGAIVGWLYKGTLENCASYVNVTSTGASETGGITGTSEKGTITKCINYGTVKGTDSVGGIAGKASGTLTSCRNYGKVSGNTNVNEIYGSAHSTGTPILYDCGVENEFFISDGSIKDPTDFDYSFAVIGDPQCIVEYAREMNSDKYLKRIYDYIIDNVSSKKIKHVFHLGDLVQTTWPYISGDTAKNKMYAEAELITQQIIKLDGVVDYSLIRGNHDPADFYDEYFGVNSTKTGYASHIEDYYINSTNSVHYFSAGDLDYMVVTLDFGAGDPVLEWASEVISAHPHHNVIIVTHAYMDRDGTTLGNSDAGALKTNGTNDPLYNTAMGATANNGDHMWDKLISQHENIVLVLSGHIGTEDVICSQWKGVHGNTVTNILIDPQDMDTLFKSQGSVGAIAMFYFSNGGKTVEVRYWSTVQNAYIKTENQYTFTINTIQ